MLFCETAGASSGDVEDLAIFASQLAALGVPARVDVGSVPEDDLGHSLQFDLAPRLADGGLRPGDRLALLAADRLTDAALVRLRRFADGVEVTARAFGIFARRETALERAGAALLRLRPRARALRRQPGRLQSARRPAPAFGVPRRAPPAWQAGRGAAAAAAGRAGSEGSGAGGGARGARAAPQPSRDGPHRQQEQAGLDRRPRPRHPVLPLRRDPAAGPRRAHRRLRLLRRASAAATGCRRWSRTCSSTGRRSSTAAPAAGLRSHNDAFIAAPPGILGLDSFLDAEILPEPAARSPSTCAAAARAAAASAEPVLRFLGAEAAAPRRPGARRPRPAAPAGSSSCRRTASGSATPSAAR